MVSQSQPKRQDASVLKKRILPIILLLIVILIISFLAYSSIPRYEAVSNAETDKLFKLDLQHFANTIAVDDEKFFVLDDYGNLTCLDAATGKEIWQANVGGWRSGGLLVKNGIIYAGSSGSIIQAIDEATGNLLRNYTGLLSTSWKGPAQAYSVADGRIFIEQDGCVAYNIANGEELWKSYPCSMINPQPMPYTDKVWSFERKLVLAQGTYFTGNQSKSMSSGVYRIDPDKGTPLWSVEGSLYQEPLVYQNLVILPNYAQKAYVPEQAHSVIAVTISSGVKIWSYDVGSPIFKPVIYGDQLLFAAQNGNFYALNLSNGTLSWKTRLANSIPSDAGVSSIAIDEEKQEVYWAYGVTQQNSTGNYVTYEGTLYRLNLVNGQNLIKSDIRGTAAAPFFTKNNPTIGLALLRNTAYLTAQTDLWRFNKMTLSVLSTEHFDHTLLQPIAAYDRVYVTADLYAVAYEDIGS
jgi:outer membrane protein assembly factor BamB